MARVRSSLHSRILQVIPLSAPRWVVRAVRTVDASDGPAYETVPVEAWALVESWTSDSGRLDPPPGVETDRTISPLVINDVGLGPNSVDVVDDTEIYAIIGEEQMSFYNLKAMVAEIVARRRV